MEISAFGFNILQYWSIVTALVMLIGVCVFRLFNSLLSGFSDAPWLVYNTIKGLRAYLQFYDGILTGQEDKRGQRTAFSTYSQSWKS